MDAMQREVRAQTDAVRTAASELFDPLGGGAGRAGRIAWRGSRSANHVGVIASGRATLDAATGAVDGALRTVDAYLPLGFDEASFGAVADALAAAARRGVRVRVLLDAGGAPVRPPEGLATLVAAGVESSWVRHDPDRPLGAGAAPTSEAILVVDGQQAIVGPLRAEAQAADAPWARPFGITLRIVGKAARHIRSGLIETWERRGYETPAPLPARNREPGPALVYVARQDGLRDAPDFQRTVARAVRVARRSVSAAISNSGLFHWLEPLFTDAVERGVDVSLLLPAAGRTGRLRGVDGFAFHEYPGSLDGSTLVLDGRLTVVPGSPWATEGSGVPAGYVVVDHATAAAVEAAHRRAIRACGPSDPS